MNRISVIVLLHFCALFAPAVALADSLGIATIDRGTTVFDGNVATHGISATNAAEGIYDEGATTSVAGKNLSASQWSVVDAAQLQFGGTGDAFAAYSIANGSGAWAQSFFEVTFTATSTFMYALEGTLFADFDGGRGYASAALQDLGSGNALFREEHSAYGSFDLASAGGAEGTFGPGTYKLSFAAYLGYDPAIRDPNAFSFFGGSTSFDFSLGLTEVQVTPIPEPETYALMLAGLGLLGIAACRRRRL